MQINVCHGGDAHTDRNDAMPAAVYYSKGTEEVYGQILDFGHLEPEEGFLEGFHGIWQNMAEPDKVSAESEEGFLAAQKFHLGHRSLKNNFWRPPHWGLGICSLKKCSCQISGLRGFRSRSLRRFLRV